MKVFNRTLMNNVEKSEQEESRLTLNEINETISLTQYLKSDSFTTALTKYKTLCDLKEKCDDKKQKKEIHNAQWVFVNSIQTPRNKEEILDFIINTLPFAKTDSIGSEVLSTMASIGIKTLKGVSTVGKVATLGLASNAIGKMENMVQKALVSQDVELTMLWRKKLASIFEEAKTLSGGLLSKDKDFTGQLKELKRQYDEICRS